MIITVTLKACIMVVAAVAVTIITAIIMGEDTMGMGCRMVVVAVAVAIMGATSRIITTAAPAHPTTTEAAVTATTTIPRT